MEADGHTVIVADPNVAPLCATRSRRVKTDRRDARTLCEACVLRRRSLRLFGILSGCVSCPSPVRHPAHGLLAFSSQNRAPCASDVLNVKTAGVPVG